MKYDVFISYSRKDFDEVSSLLETIRKEIPDLSVWFDVTGIESGDEFEDKIISAIDNSSYVLFALSENSLQSQWTKDEVMYARNTDKKVIPILLKDAELKGWFLFKFGRVDCIDSTSMLQMNKLMQNLSSWTGKRISEPQSAPTAVATPVLANPSEPLCPCGSGKLFTDCHGKEVISPKESITEIDEEWIKPLGSHEISIDDKGGQTLIAKDDKYLYLVRKQDDSYEIFDKSGDRIDGIDRIEMVDSCFRVSSQDTMPPYIVGYNSKDKNLYFISSKQIIPLCNWEKGERCDCYLPAEKELIVDDDFSGFYIKDKYDYITHYEVNNGFCVKTEKNTIQVHSDSLLPYYLDDDGKLISADTEEQVTIPGFKFAKYLGVLEGVELFWAMRYFNPDRPSKDSFIVDKGGRIIRKYDSLAAFSFGGKYIMNVTYNGQLNSITTLNGDILIRCNDEILAGEPEEVSPNVYKVSSDSSYDTWYWLVKENVFCTMYCQHYYVTQDEDCQERLYLREKKEFIGEISCHEGVKTLPDDLIYVCLRGRYWKGVFLDHKGDVIYSLDDNEYSVAPRGDRPCVSENRILINVDNRYYKILDYSGNEIARIDFDILVDSYYQGKLFYFNNKKIGYYDCNASNHLIPYEGKDRINGVEILSINKLLLKLNNKEAVINLDGAVILEGRCIVVNDARCITVINKKAESVVYNAECEMLFPIETGDYVYVLG